MTTCPLCATKHDGPCYQEFRHNLNRTQNNMKTEHKETQEGYCVLITRRDGTKYPWMHEPCDRSMAIKRARTAKAISSERSIKVVKARITWEVIQ